MSAQQNELNAVELHPNDQFEVLCISQPKLIDC